MKKTILLLAVFVLIASSAFADTEERTTKGFWGKEGTVMGRGAVNILTCLSEHYYTIVREKKLYPESHAISYIPKSFLNVITRISSGAYDMIPLAIMAPFTDNLTPLTKPMGLPDYPWSDY